MLVFPTPANGPLTYIDPGTDMGGVSEPADVDTGVGTLAELTASLKPDLSPSLSSSAISDTQVDSGASTAGSAGSTGSSECTASALDTFTAEGWDFESFPLLPSPCLVQTGFCEHSVDLLTPSDTVNLEASYLASALEWFRRKERSLVVACPDTQDEDRPLRLSPIEAKRLEASYLKAAIAFLGHEKGAELVDVENVLDEHAEADDCDIEL